MDLDSPSQLTLSAVTPPSKPTKPTPAVQSMVSVAEQVWHSAFTDKGTKKATAVPLHDYPLPPRFTPHWPTIPAVPACSPQRITCLPPEMRDDILQRAPLSNHPLNLKASLETGKPRSSNGAPRPRDFPNSKWMQHALGQTHHCPRCSHESTMPPEQAAHDVYRSIASTRMRGEAIRNTEWFVDLSELVAKEPLRAFDAVDGVVLRSVRHVYVLAQSLRSYRRMLFVRRVSVLENLEKIEVVVGIHASRWGCNAEVLSRVHTYQASPKRMLFEVLGLKALRKDGFVVRWDAEDGEFTDELRSYKHMPLRKMRRKIGRRLDYG